MSILARKLFQQLHWMEFLGFVVVGAINTGTTFIIYLGLLLVLRYDLAYTSSYVLGIFLSYGLNATFVFGEKLRVSRALQYSVVYLTQYILSMAVLYLLVEVLGCSKVIAPLLIVLITLPTIFLLTRYLIKRPVRCPR